jgi:transposase
MSFQQCFQACFARRSLREHKEPKRYRRCCGIDVYKKSVTVCILAPEGKRDVEIRKRNFRTFTRDLKQLRLWLKNCRVTEIAMEYTGQYWRPLWNLLEGSI